MNKTMLRVALLSCATLAVGPAMANHSWGGYHWARTSNPLKLDILTSITASKWGTSVGTAITDWKQSSVLQLNGPISSAVNPRKCTAISGKVLICNAAYGQRGWLGIATIWLSGNHITQGTTKLNDSYHDYAPYNSDAWRSLVACQEPGHNFGLAHQNEEFGPPNIGSCMDYTNQPAGGGDFGPSNEHPDTHDYNQLASIYSHTDSTNSSATQTTNFGVRIPGQAAVAPPGLNNDPGDSPAEWGRAIATDGEGRPNLFVQDLGGGRKKVTHVFWAIGEGTKGKQQD